jgi:DNA primase
MSATYVDFKELKARVSIHQVAVSMLGLQLTQKGDQYRGCCPIHRGTNPREFSMNASKNLWNCFGGCGGGDQIALVAKVKDIPQKEAAQLIDEYFGLTITSTAHRSAARAVHPTVSAHSTPGPTDGKEKALQPLPYLEATHPKVQALGVSPETAELFASGYAAKGVLRGRFAVPIRNKDGALLAYVGIAVEREQSPHLQFHNFDPHSMLFNIDRVAEGGDLYVCRDPLRAILAVENGVPAESVVSFLSPITAQSLEMLSSLMDEKKVETCELF